MLREEPKVPAEVLAVQPAAVRGAPHVDTVDAGEKHDLPPRLPEAEAPVRLLAEEEEVLVEQTDLVDRVRGARACRRP